MRISAKDAAVILKAEKAAQGNRRVKGAKRVNLDGIWFDSQREATQWAALMFRQRAGQISDLRRQVKIPLKGAAGPILTPTGRQMHYVADFVFFEDGLRVIADAKGHPTEVFQIKQAVLAAMGYKIRIL
ncbi:DUF1064 domain-containing protein [Fuscibacter oryzae]|uniref:DUF1064 domain-containing protein n=1 Tax=Fuscibacter oryzae TaxID=2803939 RepID=A0A8J7MXV2_9RHOB|nr:DUF1064 domain-containing protein [Fuscibacter oryzae]MBL4929369.1 DUF1064 domain-containing protein [Fuscibacter oryzae]